MGGLLVAHLVRYMLRLRRRCLLVAIYFLRRRREKQINKSAEKETRFKLNPLERTHSPHLRTRAKSLSFIGCIHLPWSGDDKNSKHNNALLDDELFEYETFSHISSILCRLQLPAQPPLHPCPLLLYFWFITIIAAPYYLHNNNEDDAIQPANSQ